MELKKTVVLPILVGILFSTCSFENSEIRTVCETNEIGDYLIKWETFPQMNASVKIYEFSNPDSLETRTFISEQPIKVGVATVFGNNSDKRRYFELVFDNDQSVVVAERHIKLDNVSNFRDLGGYNTADKKIIKWGKIYRSGSIALANKKDLQKIQSLGIKTVIDCRTEEEIKQYPSKFKSKRLINLPLRGMDIDRHIQKILNGEMKRGDVLVMEQDLYVELLTNNTDYIEKMFDVLLDPDSYPVLINCSLGKDRVGLMAALILGALNVNKELVVQDYMLSNSGKYINFNKLVKDAGGMDYEVQVALTALLGTNENTLEYIFKRIDKDHESLDNYFEKELKLTHKKREKLKDLLLY